jgi:dTMP kinase
MYIVFEGPDGSGKSTQATVAYDYIKSKGKDVVLTRNPGATALGQKLRHLIKHDEEVEVDGFTERILFLADNSAFIHTILRPSLKEGKIVIADRSNFIGDYCYGVPLGVDAADLASLHRAIPDFPLIDNLIVYTCPVEISRERMSKRDGPKCKIEQRSNDYFVNVANYYEEASRRFVKNTQIQPWDWRNYAFVKNTQIQPWDWRNYAKSLQVIDGRRSLKEITESTKRIIDNLLD